MGVEDIGDVIRGGGGALAKGLFRGVTGILTKPLEGAKSSGVEGFVQGVGKGIIGAAAQPVSGVLDLLSKTTEGANAVKMKLASALTSEEQLLRRRLARAIGGDSLLRPYDEYKATGQVPTSVSCLSTTFFYSKIGSLFSHIIYMNHHKIAQTFLLTTLSKKNYFFSLLGFLAYIRSSLPHKPCTVPDFSIFPP